MSDPDDEQRDEQRPNDVRVHAGVAEGQVN
jgi:hypothetical protein